MVSVAKTNDTDPYFEDWDEPDDTDLEAELLSRAAARGPEFERLVDAVIDKIGWEKGNRDRVRLWLIGSLERFERHKIVQADVRKWCVKVSKRAASLAKLLESNPFPKGSVQSQFAFIYKDVELPDPGDIAHLWKMAEAAEVMARRYRKVGAGGRRDREALINQLADGFERLTSKRATATAANAFCEVVTDVLHFVGEPREEDTVTGAVKRVLKTRRLLRAG
jgi:nucleoid DNA-binding protein